MNYDSKIKYVTSDLFLIECDWLLLNNLFKIKFAIEQCLQVQEYVTLANTLYECPSFVQFLNNL